MRRLANALAIVFGPCLFIWRHLKVLYSGWRRGVWVYLP